jgi:hypothetical protein
MARIAAKTAMAFLIFALPQLALGAPECRDFQKRALLAEASKAEPSFDLNCSVKLDADTHVITKTVRIHGKEASGVTLDCGGSSIKPAFGQAAVEIYSDEADGGHWSRPENVRVTNCRITGSGAADAVKVWGGSAFESSHSLGHTQRMQAAAPRNIIFSGVTITAAGGIPLYVFPGVTYLSLLRSEINGEGEAVAIYLDAETAHNTIRDNYIHLASAGREQLAIDGSAHNLIVNNRFSGLNTGGIYLYRNCGEDGIVRHQTPSHNQIINNVFYYKTYSGGNPSVWVASRNRRHDDSFCGKDDDFPFGSGARDQDDAHFNVIAQNQIYRLPVTKMIRVSDAPNYLFENRTVQTAERRFAGCYVGEGPSGTFIHNGENVAKRSGDSSGTRYSCRNGALLSAENLRARKLRFQCAKSGGNGGCSLAFACPDSGKLIGIKLGCNLELADLPASDVGAMAWDHAKVFRESDKVSDGQCGLRPGISIRSGAASLAPLLGTASGFTAFCSERDKNGGDCIVRGEALCL